MQKGIVLVPVLIILGLLGLSGFFAYRYSDLKKEVQINSFEECGKKYPVMESYPAQCNTPDGKHFVQEVSDEEKKKLVPASSGFEEPPFKKWETYKNDKYAFQFDYPSSLEFQESKDQEVDSVYSMNSCVGIYAGREGFEKKIKESSKGTPFDKLSELSVLREGESRTYPEDKREKREDGSPIIKFNYKKIADKEIGGIKWTAFEASNNWENHSYHFIYFVSRKDNLYVLDFNYGGSCYEEEPLKALNSFKFID